MIKVNKFLILTLFILVIVVSCKGEGYSNYLRKNKLLEVARIKLERTIVHIVVNKNISKFNFDSMTPFDIIISSNDKLEYVLMAKPHSSYQPVFKGENIVILATQILNESSGISIIYYNEKSGLKIFPINYTKIDQLLYFKGKIYTTWDKSMDHLRIIDIETGEVAIPETNPLFFGDLFILNGKLFARDYDYRKRQYTKIYNVNGNELIPYTGDRFITPKIIHPTLDDYMIDK